MYISDDVHELASRCDSQGMLIAERINQLDIRFQCLETCSYDGILIWKIVDYERRKLDAIQGRNVSLQSQPIYTHSYGFNTRAGRHIKDEFTQKYNLL